MAPFRYAVQGPWAHLGLAARRPRPKPTITRADWEAMRNFKPTQLTRNESGIEKDIDSLRMLLNKITKTNYPTMKEKIKVLRLFLKICFQLKMQGMIIF